MIRNPIETLRMRNILGAPQPASPTFPGRGMQTIPSLTAPPPPQSDAERYLNEMERIQSTVGPGMQRYREALNTAPEREEHKPGVFTRIAAALAGFSGGMRNPADGIDAARSINEHGYNTALFDYNNRLKTLGEAANIEQDETNAKLRYLLQARALGLKYDEFELKRLETENKMRNESANAGSARMRAEAYAKAQARPGYDAHAQEDGSVLYVNKANPGDRQVVPAKTVQAGQLGVSRRNAAVAEGQLGNSVRRTNIYEQSQADASRRGWTGLSIRNRAAQNTGNTPTQLRGASLSALREMMNDEAFRDFIEIDADGTPMAIEDDGSEEYQIFLEALNAKIAESRGGR